MVISIYHILGILLAIILIEFVGIKSSKKVKNADDFSHGSGKAGTWVVCGTIMGTLIGGQSTIGTAQLAFSYGISAWWFTLGAALGCVFLAIAYAAPLRKSNSTTLLEYVSKEYGKKAEITGSVLCSIGMFISIVAQVLSSSALLMTLFPMKFYIAAMISVLIMIFYVVFGGLWSAGIGGIVKIILLCISSLAGGIIVLYLAKGYSGLMETIDNLFLNTDVNSITDLTTVDALHHRFKNILSRGPIKDMGSCLSVILGVLATQSYAQGIWAAKSDSVARKGAMISALLTIPIGAACVLIGLYMRGHYITSAEVEALTAAGKEIPDGINVIMTSAQVFPLFITRCIPEFLGGIVLGTLLVTVIIGGSGLTLGSSTILVRDVFVRINPNLKESRKNLKLTRLTIVGILAMSVVVATSFSGTFINDLGFLSMGLRATAVFVPLSMAIFFPNRFKSSWILVSIIAGTASLFIAKIIPLPIDGIFIAMTVSLICCLPGIKKRNSNI